MKRIILMVLMAAVAAGGWSCTKNPGAAPAAEKPEEPRIKTDTNGNVVVRLEAEMRKRADLKIETLAPVQIKPELKGYGHVLDPAPLAALVNELNAAQAAYAVSSRELERLKRLQSQGNTSERALQTAEAAALRDQLLIQSAKDRLTLSWGKELAERDDLAAFIQSLVSLETALVRIDLPAGENLSSPPAGARIITLSGKTVAGQFLSLAPGVDPQVQGQGFLFLIKAEPPKLLLGEAVTGYLQVSGPPLDGVVIPRDAVVRTEGSGWVYVQVDDDNFARKPVVLEHPVESGWFVTNGVASGERLVVGGAQALLSEESRTANPPGD